MFGVFQENEIHQILFVNFNQGYIQAEEKKQEYKETTESLELGHKNQVKKLESEYGDMNKKLRTEYEELKKKLESEYTYKSKTLCSDYTDKTKKLGGRARGGRLAGPRGG